MFYPLARSVLFQLDAETSHHCSLNCLRLVHRYGFSKLLYADQVNDPTRIMGLQFANKVGLAAGLDKNGDYIDALAVLGFGAIEIGTVTPRPQLGNPTPRLFRLPKVQAIINRMGFNNKGVDYLISKVNASHYDGILGINIGKNADTPLEKSVDDYVICLRKVYAFASYVVINISSPNTKNLRQLQQGDELNKLLNVLKQEQHALKLAHGKYVPVVVKIAPDLTGNEVDAIAQRLLANEIDGVIATNTTIDKQAVAHLAHGAEQGGLSGAPLTQASTMLIHRLVEILGDAIPVIGVGGIMSAQDAIDKTQAGARLVQIYTGLVYQGPGLIRQIATVLKTG